MDTAAINELLKNALDQANARAEQKFEERLTALREEFNQKHQTFISRRNLLLTKPITYHMDFITELHPLVEGHLMDARVQGE